MTRGLMSGTLRMPGEGCNDACSHLRVGERPSFEDGKDEVMRMGFTYQVKLWFWLTSREPEVVVDLQTPTQVAVDDLLVGVMRLVGKHWVPLATVSADDGIGWGAETFTRSQVSLL